MSKCLTASWHWQVTPTSYIPMLVCICWQIREGVRYVSLTRSLLMTHERRMLSDVSVDNGNKSNRMRSIPGVWGGSTLQKLSFPLPRQAIAPSWIALSETQVRDYTEGSKNCSMRCSFVSRGARILNATSPWYVKSTY